MDGIASDQTIKPGKRPYFFIVAILALLLLLTLTLYTLLHESGHALVGLLFGGKITSFSVNFLDLSAHVGIDGEFSLTQHALISLAGVSLPILVCMAFLFLSTRKTEPVLDWFKILFFMSSVCALLAWIAIPVLVMAGETVSDDSANFLNYTHFPPLLVTTGALLVFGLCWAVFLRWMGGFRGIAARFRSVSLDPASPPTRKNALRLAGLAAVVLAAALSLTLALPDRTFEAPVDYQMVAELKLSEKAILDQSVYRFSLQGPASPSLFFGLHQVQGAPVSIRLTGPNGYDNSFLSMQDPKTNIGNASVHPRKIQLAKGDYEIRVSFPQSPGWVKVYVKME